MRFVEARAVSRSLKKPIFSKERWTLVNDLMAAGVACGVWETEIMAMNCLANYFTDEARYDAKKGLLEKTVIDCLVGATGIPATEWVDVTAKNFVLSVPPAMVREAIKSAVDDGFLKRPEPTEIQDLLQRLGWCPAKPNKGAIVYRYRGTDDA